MKQNGMDIPVVTEIKGGLEAAKLTRHVLKTQCGIDGSKKIALPKKIKGEIAKDISLQKKTDLSKATKGKSKGANAKNNKNNIPR